MRYDFRPSRFAAALLAKYPDALRLTRSFYADRRSPELSPLWPDWCGLPMTAAHAIISAAHAAPDALSKDIAPLTASILWAESKPVYRLDPDLARALREQPLDGDIPDGVFSRLPYPCIYVESAQDLQGVPTYGFFIWLEYDPRAGKELRILFLEADGFLPFYVPLTGGTLESACQAVVKGAQASAPGLDPDAAGVYLRQYTQAMTGAINAALYICSENADMAEIIHHKTPARPGLVAASPGCVTDVGFRIGRALRAATDAHDGPAPHGSHASPAPHMRRAHWHHFWTGPHTGDRALILRWLPPIPVKVSPEAATIPTIHVIHGERKHDRFKKWSDI